MTKVLHCSDLMPGCSFEARGSSEEEVMAQAAEHAKSAHGLGKISEDMAMQVRGAIHEENESEEQAEEVIVVESADDAQPAEVSEAGDGSKEEEPVERTLSEVLAVVQSAEKRSEENEEGGQAQAAGA